MKIVASLIVLLLICLSGCQEDSEPPKTNEDKQATIATAEKLGRMLYENDQYAATATDVMLENLPNPEEKGIQGWITLVGVNHTEVLFVKSQQDQFLTPCQVIFKDNKRPNFIQDERPLTELEAEMFRARQHAPEIIEQYCSDTYNTVVLPSPDNKTWYVYALAATTDPQIIVVGGHYRAIISLDGTTILSKRGFTNTCLQIPFPSLPEGEKPTAYYLTHLLDDTPTEIHVFLSLLYKIPCNVVTKDGQHWFIKDGIINLVKSK